MNINEVEKLTGISKQNIRFYEKSGLVCPKRNTENGYREYSSNEIRILKLVKVFRMLDMPIEQIKSILYETDDLSGLLCEHEKMLEQKLINTKYAISLCEDLRRTHHSIADIDVDSYLHQMEKEPDNFFNNWISDYKKVIQYEHQKTFTFTPDEEITDRYHFENALYAYAMKNNKEITITKEGMYPEFIMDGIQYKAERNYTSVMGIPLAVVRCTRVDAAETDVRHEHGRKKWMRILHICQPTILGILFMIFSRGISSLKELFSTSEGIVLLIAIILVCITMCIRNYYLYWNLND